MATRHADYWPSRPVATAALALLFGSFVVEPGYAQAAFTLRVQWEWVGAIRSPDFPAANGVPIVVNLTDDDGDGNIGPGDIPEVVFYHRGSSGAVLTAVDGLTGDDLFTTTAPILRDSGLAAGDLNGDGRVEILAMGYDRSSIVAFRNDGSFAWQVPVARCTGNCQETLGIADMDQDGSPEIYLRSTVLAADGSFRWGGSASVGNYVEHGRTMSTAVDLLPCRPGLELVAGPACHGSDGALIWSRLDILDGWSSVGDLDGDGLAEIVILTGDLGPNRRELHLLDRDGASLTAPLVKPLSLCQGAGAPTLADLDGDGGMDIIVPMGPTLDAYEWDGSTLRTRWSTFFGCDDDAPSATAFDLDGDGLVEILYDNGRLQVVEGRTGVVLDERLTGGSNDGFRHPVVADIDADGLPEIVVANFVSVIAYESDVPVPTRCIWNQHSYHGTNVNDDGSIPRIETPPWRIGAGWLIQEARACGEPINTTPYLRAVTICEGASTLLDASALADPDCPGGNTFTWTDELGLVVGTGATVLVSPTTSTTFAVLVECPGSPSCGSSVTFMVRVTVEQPPLLSGVIGTDPDRCNLGLELTWDPATFRDPSGTGVYNVYRSETSCLDALAQPPVATGLTTLRWVDVATRPGQSYLYVVQAEDARTATACVPGPNNGGATTTACVGPILESPEAYTPDLLGWALRASHVGPVVTMTWPTGRSLLPGEHYHVLKGHDATSFVMVNGEGDLSTTWTETDTSRPLQFFDVRIANPCEIVSADDEPPGWDAPHP